MKMTKSGLHLCVVVLMAALFLSVTGLADDQVTRGIPIPLIFDTDIGNDVDDVLALRNDSLAAESRCLPAAGRDDYQRSRSVCCVC